MNAQRVTALATMIWRREHGGRLSADELDATVRVQLEELV